MLVPADKTKRVVYTCITNQHDSLIEPTKELGWEYVCFTDSRTSRSDVWDIRPIPPDFRLENPRRTARKVKLLSHVLFPEADIVAWVDGNISINCNLTKKANALLTGVDLSVLTHPDSTRTIFGEARLVKKLIKDEPAVVNAHMEWYRSVGFPDSARVYATGIMFRRNTDIVAKFNTAWWREISSGSLRDQLSFPYAAWITGISFSNYDGLYSDNKDFSIREHGLFLPEINQKM